jgi:hypothetical protein
MKQRLSATVSADRASEACYTNTDPCYRNPYAVTNVNQPMGPRTGNEGAHAAKRGNFLDAKAERAPLADQVMAGFAGRARELEANPGNHEVPGSGGIASNNPVRRFAARKNRNRD